MINATTVSSPFEIMTERSSTVSLQKHDSEAPKFGAVLNNKLKDKNPSSLEAHEDKLERVKTRSESKVKAKDETKANPKNEHAEDEVKLDAKNEPKVDEAQAKPDKPSDADTSAETKPQPETQKTADKSEDAQHSVDESPHQAVNAQVASTQQNPVQQTAVEITPEAQLTQAAPTETVASVPTTENVEEPIAAQTDTKTVTPATPAQVEAKIAVEDIVKQAAATAPQAPNVEQTAATVAQPQVVSQMEAVVETVGQNAATTANLPIAETKPTDKADAKPADSSNTKNTFFGLTAKTADPNAASSSSTKSEKDSGQNAGSGNQTKNELPLLAGRRQQIERPFAQSANTESNGLVPSVMPAKAEATQPLDLSGNMTFSPQVIKAIAGDSASVMGMPAASAAPETQAATAVSSVSDNPTAAVVLPGKSSLDNSLRGLETIQKPQVSTPTNADLQSKIMDQLVREVKLRQFQGQSDIMVKLNPAELGQIRLQITQTAQGLTTQINASNEQVRGLLQAHIPALTNALADAGLKMDQVSVTSESSFNSLMQENTSGAAYQQQNRSRQHNSGNGQNVNVNPAVINAANGLGAAGSAGYSWLA